MAVAVYTIAGLAEARAQIIRAVRWFPARAGDVQFIARETGFGEDVVEAALAQIRRGVR